MTRTIRMIPILAIAALALPGAALADKSHNKGGNVYTIAANCPPGLAKKAVPCVPPGQAKKAPVVIERHDRDHDGRRPVYDSRDYDRHYDYRVGDVVHGDYIVIREPSRYGLDPNGTYYRMGEGVYQVDSDTRKVLAVIGLASAFLN